MKTALLPLFATLALALFALGAKPPQEAAKKTEAQPNPVQVEMQLLQVAMTEAVQAIGKGDVRHLPPLFHRVHLAADKTQTEANKGTYKPPKNADKIAHFKKLDREFHLEMIKLVKAAKKNNVDEVAHAFADLVVRCQSCHRTFR
jgi:cytochrome c556